MTCELVAVDGGFALRSPFHRPLVDAIKALPFTDRRWDPARKVWIVAPSQVRQVVQLVEQHTGQSLQIPAAIVSGPTLRAVRMEYLGRCKPRDTGSFASGFADGSWSLLFPEQVLKSWFEGEEPDAKDQGKPKTLYQILTVKQDATADDLKQAYRRLVMQTHPDRNKEPDAREQFEQIQAAYEVLRDDQKRKRYNAGLKLEATLYQRPKNFQVHRHTDDAYGYRSPLRCGLLFVEGTFQVGQLIVSKIMSWSDIHDNRGRTMVASWPAGAETFTTEWF